jgi:hypothetical protein
MMKKAVLAVTFSATTMAASLGFAVSASAQTAMPTTTSCSTAPGIDAFIYGADNGPSAYNGVEADIDSNPCGFAVQAAATCISTHSPYDETNVYGTSVYDDGGKSYARCGTNAAAGVVHGGWRYDDNGTWVYHTYAVEA